MDDAQVDYLSDLPDEIKLMVFQHLDSFTIITLKEISKKFASLSVDKQLSSTLCFYNDYRFKLVHLRNDLHKLRREIITSLNLNCVYWIPRNEMKRCLSLDMLDSLYVLDTNLRLHDICSKNKLNLKTLAITVTDTDASAACYDPIRNLKKLCVHYWNFRRFKIVPFIQECEELEELWVVDVGRSPDTPRLEDRIYINFERLKRLVIMRNTHFTDSDKKHHIAFMCHRGKANLCIESTNSEICDIYKSEFYETVGCVEWNRYLNELNCDNPFSLHDAKKLVYKQATLDDIQFQELSFIHKRLCSEVLKPTVIALLALPNTRFLRKLSINRCILTGNHELSVEHSRTELFKSSRISRVHVAQSTLDAIVEHSPLIEELEILDCERGGTVANAIDYSCIGKLSKLKSLVLEYSNIDRDRTYLLDICKSCSNLTSLKFWMKRLQHHSFTLLTDLRKSIPFWKALKDLRYEQFSLPLDVLMESLASNSQLKLERIVLLCNKTDAFSSEPLVKFIKRNPQLILVYICVINLPDAFRIQISRTLKHLKTQQQIFIITNRYKSPPVLPHVHVLEMMEYNTSVSVIHPFKDFY
uniref:F-box domain-containing protein n=1 Tax=Photinus pyralis TaxID=7054 RepID=A0A1Y1LWQ7_PHOPY